MDLRGGLVTPSTPASEGLKMNPKIPSVCPIPQAITLDYTSGTGMGRMCNNTIQSIRDSHQAHASIHLPKLHLGTAFADALRCRLGVSL
jgi:hypothetical protein